MGKIEMNDSRTLVSMDGVLPPKVYMIPLKSRPIFPGIFMPVRIDDEKQMKTVEKVLETDGFIGLVLLKNQDINDIREDNFYRVGTTAKIVKKINLPDGKINIFINTLKRFEIKKFLSFEPYISAGVSYVEEKAQMDDEISALARTLYSEIKEVSEDNPFFTEEIKLNMANMDG
ncbi:MAG: LON peptidase substrate-binding domain-containing protein, partial [Spirochaetota bacterium]